MPGGAKKIVTIHESAGMTDALWQQFRAKCIAEGKSPTGALAELIRAYLADAPDRPRS